MTEGPQRGRSRRRRWPTQAAERVPICRLRPPKGTRCWHPPAEGSPAKDNPYAARYFHYDPVTQTVTCPQGQSLAREGYTIKHGVRVQRYRCHCRDCPVAGQCTRDPKGRQIEVRPHTAVVQAMRQRLAQPVPAAQYAQRRQIIERLFAQIKAHEGFRRWTVWGLEKVRTQWTLLRPAQPFRSRRPWLLCSGCLIKG
jgi:hypothetical protein